MADSKAKKPNVDDTKAKVFDVAKPSEVAAEPTSRPIIVGHGKSLQRDPMMAADESTETKPAEASELSEETKLEKPKRELKLEPDAPSKEPETPEPALVEPAIEEDNPEEKTAIDDQLPSDSAAVDALADTVSIKREEEAALEAEAKKLEEIEKVIASKQYFVKVKTPPGKRNMQWLALFVLLIAAAAAWYLLLGPGKDLWAKEEPIPSAQVASQVTPAAVKPEAAPAKPVVSEFFNTSLGVSFTYPSDWGEVVIQDNSKITSEKGKRTLLTFTKNKNVTAGMKSKDWSDSSRDVNADCGKPGFVVFFLEKTAKDNGKTVISEKSDLQVFEELTGGLCNDVQVIANKKFTRSKVYTGLQIWHQSKVTDKLDLAQRITDYNKDPNKYVTQQLRDQVTAAIESAKEL